METGTDVSLAKYENKEYAFRFAYAREWIPGAAPPGVIVMIFAPRGKNGQEDGKDRFKANVNVVCHRVVSAQHFALNQICEASQQQLKTMLGNFEMLSVDDIEFAGLRGVRLKYSGVVGGRYLASFLQYVTMKGGFAYALTYSASKEDYADHGDDVRRIVGAFELL